MLTMFKNDKGAIPVVILIFVVGLLAFFAVSTLFQFNDKLFQTLYVKKPSLADVNAKIPAVDLKINYQNSLIDGVISISKRGQLELVWTVTGDPTYCIGRAWGIDDIDETWNGSKDITGGNFKTKKLTVNNPFVYSIDCSNQTGDSSGDSVTINVGAPVSELIPYLDKLKAQTPDGIIHSWDEVISLNQGEKIKINWSSLNTNTPYSICVSTGSWPTGYKGLSNSTIEEEFVIQTRKVHKFRVYCSNESLATENNLTIYP